MATITIKFINGGGGGGADDDGGGGGGVRGRGGRVSSKKSGEVGR